MPTVKELEDQIHDLRMQIKDIQKSCLHPMYKVAMYSWRIGAYAPVKICDVCGSNLVGITDEEAAECWSKHQSFQQSQAQVTVTFKKEDNES